MRTIQLCDRYTCTGCSSCYNSCPRNAIQMQYDQEGFLNPHIIKENCISCGICEKTCPVLSPRESISKEPTFYAAININEEDRRNSASGGVFSAFARYFYKEPRGYVVAASFDEHLHLRHSVSKSIGDLVKYRGSKYVQSEIGTIYREVKALLLNGDNVFFIGTPCQVSGLKSFLVKDYENLFTIDLICHGVPSPILFSKYLRNIGIDTSKKYKNYLFRERNNSAFFTSTIIPKFGFRKSVVHNKHSYICAYLQSWIHRESCYNCHFSAIPRQGDCSIGDFWGILSGKIPFKYDKRYGVSMVMVNSEKGEQIFNRIKESLQLEEKTQQEALVDNHNIIEHDIRPSIRDISYYDLLHMSSEDFMSKYHLYLPRKTTIFQRAINKIYKIIRTKFNNNAQS